MSGATCAICGGRLDRELLVITKPDRFERHAGIGEQGYRRVWTECPICGTATNVLSPGSDRLADIERAYYVIDFQGSLIADKFAKITALPPERSDNAARVGRIIDFLEKWMARSGQAGPTRALDIGAGTGVFPARFLERVGPGWAMTAIEPDPMAASHLTDLRKFEVVNEAFPYRGDRGRFHLVTLNKVIEHSGAPVDFLRAVARVLDSTSGIAYIEVPDKQTIFCRPSTDNILGALHRHLYDLSGLLRLVGEAGLIPIRIERVVEPSGKLTVFCFAALPATVARLSLI